MRNGLLTRARGRQAIACCSCITIWPTAVAMGASFNQTAWRAMGRATAGEMRGMNNVQWGAGARPDDGIDALIAWGPVINLVRRKTAARCRSPSITLSL